MRGLAAVVQCDAPIGVFLAAYQFCIIRLGSAWGLRHQSVIGCNARSTRNAALIRYCSKLSRSRINPPEHVGEQNSGAGGCRACRGKGGIAGGAITSGGDGGAAVSQPVSSSHGTDSSSADNILSEFGMAGNLLRLRGALAVDGLVGFAGGDGGSKLHGPLSVPGLLHRGAAGGVALMMAICPSADQDREQRQDAGQRPEQTDRDHQTRRKSCGTPSRHSKAVAICTAAIAPASSAAGQPGV